MAAILPAADPVHWRCVFPPLPKRQSRGRANGLCDGSMVGVTFGGGWRGSPYWWPGNVPVPILVEGRKQIEVRGAQDACIAGFWSAGSGFRQGALGWRATQGGLEVLDLHPKGWEWTRALGAGGGRWVGYGRPLAPKGHRAPEQALLWDSDGRMHALTPLEVGAEAMALATDGVHAVGHADLAGGQRAVLWPVDGSDVVLLGDPQLNSEALAVADGEQVGIVWSRGGVRAALWRGGPDTLVDLTPAGVAEANAFGCGGGYQCGSVGSGKHRTHAVLWAGNADACLDLHAFLPAPWNSSQAVAVGVFDGLLRIVGSAEQVVFEHEGARNESHFQAAQVPVIWETRIV